MRTLISNNCLVSFLYKNNNLGGFPSPFAWTRLSAVDLTNLMECFYTLNWHNIKLQYGHEVPNTIEDKRDRFVLNIDNKVVARYTHIIRNDTYSTPHIIDNDILYDRPWELIIDNYLRRTHRMIQRKCKPAFVYMDDYSRIDSIDAIHKLIETSNIVKLPLLIYTPKDITINNKYCTVINKSNGLDVCDFTTILSKFRYQLVDLLNQN